MCIEDIRLGRATGASQKTETLSTTSRGVLGNAQNRVALVFGAPTAGSVSFSINDPAVDGLGIVVSAGDTPYHLDIQKFGRLVTSPWFAVASAATPSLDIFEVFLDKE